MAGPRRVFPFVLLVVMVVATACGGDAPEPLPSAPLRPTDAQSPAEAPAFPVTVEAANGPVTLGARPERIVSLSPTATEMLFAVGAGEQVEAVDDQSTYPPEAPRTELSGIETNLEALAGYEPDLVVISNDGGLVDAVGQLGIPVILAPAAEDLEGTYAQIELLGVATGHEDEALALSSSLRSEVDGIVASVAVGRPAPTYYHELDPTLFSVTSDTFIGKVYALLGLENVAGDSAEAGTQYPQLSAEFLIAADPDLIFLADTKCCGESAATLAARPGWGGLSAVKAGRVVELDDDVASRWGPRVVDFLRAVAEQVSALEPAA